MKHPRTNWFERLCRRNHAAKAVLLLTVSALGAATPPPPVQVRYLDNDIFVHGKEYFVLRSSFEVTGPAHQWIALDMEFRLTQAIPLLLPDGKLFIKRWNNLFLPSVPTSARWADCRLDVDFPDLEKAKNLPRDKTFVVWGMGLVFDYVTSKHIGSGWSVRAPLLLTTSREGKILSAETPKLWKTKIEFVPESPTQAIDAKPVEIRTKHLVPLIEARAYEAFLRNGLSRKVVATSDGQIWRRGSFGGAFETIDSAEKAEELVLLQHPGGAILRTREQFSAVVQAVQKLGWAGAKLLPAGTEEFGIAVTPVEGLGWRVRVLLIEPRAGRWGDVSAWDYFVCSDGRLGGTRNVLILGPGKGRQTPAEAGPYTAAIRSSLAKEHVSPIESYLVTKKEIVTLPLPAGRSAEAFLPRAEFPAPPAEPAMPAKVASPPAPPAASAPARHTIITPRPIPIRRPRTPAR